MRRRNFIKHTAAAVTLPSLLNGFGVRAYANAPFRGLAGDLAVETDRVLVIVQLAGGNDGLHTLVPLDQYANLARGRAKLVLPEKSILPLTGTRKNGLHPALTGLRALYDEGLVRAVQNVGYPEPNYSHFRSTDIWMSGSDATQYVSSGWAGRYLSYEYPNFPVDYPNAKMPHPLAIEIDYSMSLTLMGPQTGMGFVISDVAEFYELLNGTQEPVPKTPAGEKLAYLRLVSEQATRYAKVVRDAAGKVTKQSPYPDTELAAKLKIVAQLIAGGLKTRLYVVTLDGFDNHDTQVMPGDTTKGDHARLLQMLGDAVLAFQRDLQFLGIDRRVTGLTMSEFGRRIAANASGGTDHGEAAPLFLFGKPVAGGILGNNPVLPNQPTTEDILPMQFDFRSVFATVLRDWFCVPGTDVPQIMLRDFPRLDLFQSPFACIPTSAHEANQQAGHSWVQVMPNPVGTEAQFQFESAGGQCVIQIMDAAGRVLETPVRGWYPEGTHTAIWTAGDLPAGAYFYRFINGTRQQTKGLVKV